MVLLWLLQRTLGVTLLGLVEVQSLRVRQLALLLPSPQRLLLLALALAARLHTHPLPAANTRRLLRGLRVRGAVAALLLLWLPPEVSSKQTQSSPLLLPLGCRLKLGVVVL